MYSYDSNHEVLDLYGLFSDYVKPKMIPEINYSSFSPSEIQL